MQLPMYSKAAEMILKNHKNSLAIFFIPFNDLSIDDCRMVSCYCIAIQDIFLRSNIVAKCIPCYNMENIAVCLGGDKMTKKYTVEIPYGSRSQYLEFVLKVNQLVDMNGFVALFVNNNPYSLESYLAIETQGEEISKLVSF